MDRYQRVEKPRVETPIDENEIRITSQGRMRNYITYAMTLLQVCLPLLLPSIFHFCFDFHIMRAFRCMKLFYHTSNWIKKEEE